MRFKPSVQGLLGIALALALAVIVGLIQRTHDFGIEYAKARRHLAFLFEGSYVPPVRTVTLSGDSVTLGDPAGGGHQLLFVFNTSCPYCKATLPVWDSLADSVRRFDSQVEIIGMAVDSVEKVRNYVADHRLEFPVVTLTTHREVVLYRAAAVPQTVVIGRGGRIRYASIGALRSGPVLDSVYRALSTDSASARSKVVRR